MRAENPIICVNRRVGKFIMLLTDYCTMHAYVQIIGDSLVIQCEGLVWLW